MFLPTGYIAVADAIEAEQYFLNEVDHDRDVADTIYDLGVALAGGHLESFGWDIETGEVFPLPKDVWCRRNSQALMERRLQFIEFESLSRSRPFVIVLELTSLSRRYSPSDLFRSCIPKFDVTHWDLSPPEMTVGIEASALNKGGRPEKFKWEEFWIEVALFADINNLTTETGDWSPLRKHMQEWVSAKWKVWPDPSQINKKLAVLVSAWEARERASKK